MFIIESLRSSSNESIDTLKVLDIKIKTSYEGNRVSFSYAAIVDFVTPTRVASSVCVYLYLFLKDLILVPNIKIAEGTYIYNSGEVISKNIEGAEFGELIAMCFDGASIVSQAEPEKDVIKITLSKNDNNGYNVVAEFSEISK